MHITFLSINQCNHIFYTNETYKYTYIYKKFKSNFNSIYVLIEKIISSIIPKHILTFKKIKIDLSFENI